MPLDIRSPLLAEIFRCSMKLRSQILIILFLFGFTPLLVSLAINLPLVMGGLELFYHKAYLQNLRADFRDLDQHLASRVEMVRLLAKLPEPGIILDEADDDSGIELEKARSRYTAWVNQLMYDQPDIIEILFLDMQGRRQFMLERDLESLELVPDANPQELLTQQHIQMVTRLEPGHVLPSPISISSPTDMPYLGRNMTLRLISPIYPPYTPHDSPDSNPTALGAVIIVIDIGGLARVYHNTHWVLDDGSYLTPGPSSQSSGSAFADFKGLKEIFAENKLALWEGSEGEQVIWVPLFATERSGPLWVGRKVDRSPITYVKRELIIRATLIALFLIFTILLFARWFAVRVERFGQDLLEGLRKVLNYSQAVTFTWRGPQELHVLGEQLTQLSKTHADNSADLQAHSKQLEKSNRYKSEFLANVSHELRTPLNSILLLSKLLSSSDLPKAYTNQAIIINEAGRNLMALIDNILDLSRIEAGKHSIHLDQVDLHGLLVGLKELFEPQFDAKGLYFQLELAEDAPRTIVTDVDKLGQIVKNFLSNAVKFTEHGGVTMTLSRNIGRYQDEYAVRISVRDTGIGIPSDKQEFIFEAFEQADGSTNRRYGGTGLGLSISRELARLLGGTIELESAEGHGSTFSILLPQDFDLDNMDEDQPIKKRQPNHGVADSVVPDADFKGCKILIVDEQLSSLLALTPLLERWGLDITAAGDASEALETLDGSDEFELVLLDIQLPDMDGFETIRRLRAQSQLDDLPVVCLSSKHDTPDRQKCLAAGAKDLLVKPVDANLLLSLLKHYLEAHD